MVNEIIFHFIIPFSYLIIIIILKRNLWDKKYDERKSAIISDVFNCVVLLYFLYIKDMFLVLMFTFYFMTRYNNNKKKNKLRIKKNK